MDQRIAHALACGVVVFSSITTLAAEQCFVQRLEGTDVSFKMVPIPAGSFLMGSPATEPGRNENEGPRHEVKLGAFYVEEHEVTWEEYDLFLNNYNRLGKTHSDPVPKDKLADAVTFPTPIFEMEAGPLLQRMGGRAAKMPAVIMSQYAARQYTKWLSKRTGRFYRLPTEAEWEYAARAGTQTAYFFGNDASKLSEYAWFSDNSKEQDGETGYHTVMTRKPNPWGLYDMYGNVMEWCIDLYDAREYAKQAGGVVDPVTWAGVSKTAFPRMLRGGGYDSDAAECRSAARMASNRAMNHRDPQLPKSPHWMSDAFYVGFRVVAPVKEPSEAEKLKWWEADDSQTISTLTRDRERKALVSPDKVEQ